MITIEIWKQVDCFENYEVSTFGRVRNRTTGRVLKTWINNGYALVSLCKCGKKKNKWVHRLVAQAFLPNPELKSDVNHKDECKSNNRLDNLEWMSHRQNCNYGTRNQRLATTLTYDRPVVQLTLDGQFVTIWANSKIAAYTLKHGIQAGHIRECCKGERKTAYRSVWCYADEFYEKE